MELPVYRLCSPSSLLNKVLLNFQSDCNNLFSNQCFLSFFPHILTNILCCQIKIFFSKPMSVKSHLKVVLVLISLIIGEINHIFHVFIGYSSFFFYKLLIHILCPFFSIGLLFFLICCNSLHTNNCLLCAMQID